MTQTTNCETCGYTSGHSTGCSNQNPYKPQAQKLANSFSNQQLAKELKEISGMLRAHRAPDSAAMIDESATRLEAIYEN